MEPWELFFTPKEWVWESSGVLVHLSLRSREGDCRGIRCGRFADCGDELLRRQLAEVELLWSARQGARVQPGGGLSGQGAFEPAEGTGIAIDLGTTTLVVQLLDLNSGAVLAVETSLNPQSAHGADVMSRITFALDGGAVSLTESIRKTLGTMISALPERDSVRIVMLAGNTVMHHLFCGISLEPLAHVPFSPVQDGEQTFEPQELGWDLPVQAMVRFLPCLGGFVGSDILAGILATRHL
jgi:hypothetical protein